MITPAGRPLARHVKGLIDALEITERMTLPDFVMYPANARERLMGQLPMPPTIRSVRRGGRAVTDKQPSVPQNTKLWERDSMAA